MQARITATSNRLAELKPALRALGESALDAGAVTCIEAATPRTPVDTGALRANVVIESGQGYRNVKWLQHYAIYQNFGTSRGVPASGFAEAGAEAGLEAINSHLAMWGG